MARAGFEWRLMHNDGSAKTSIKLASARSCSADKPSDRRGARTYHAHDEHLIRNSQSLPRLARGVPGRNGTDSTRITNMPPHRRFSCWFSTAAGYSRRFFSEPRMPTKRKAMRQIKEVLRLKFEAKLSHGRISYWHK
jgi:hypothetical protein